MEVIKRILFKEGSDVENNELKCLICNNCLCVPPILENSVFGTICGRWKCSILAHTKGQNNRQTVYETLAKYLIFPCMYKNNGCETELKWGDVEQHEEICTYKNFCCPLSMDHLCTSNEEKCNWIGDTYELISHLEEYHPSRLFLDELKLNFNRDYSKYLGEIYFTKISEDIALVMFTMDETKSTLFCKVWAGISIFKNLQYRIEIVDRSLTNSIPLKKQEAVLLNHGILNCEMCKNSLKIDLGYMDNFLEYPELIIVSFIHNSVELSPKKKFDLSLNKRSVFNAELREIKCDKCNEELCPPVSVCMMAHNICVACRKNDFCPKCSSKFSKSRNIAFEKLKFSINQPCRNHLIGCLYTAPYPIIQKHEKMCSFRLRNCILGCNKYTDNLLNHLKVDHPRSIASFDVSYSLDLLKMHIFLFENQIFLFSKKLVIDDCFYFSITCLGMTEVKYKFHLRLINDKFLGSEITLSYICHPEMISFKERANDGANDLSSIISIPYNILEQIFPDVRNTKFKLIIQKIEIGEGN
ncbi:hypothetical protein WA026_007128 [Henosepilachna vigintioctopunctata]|uniref:RING-type E3 ubiquitin transferase n=1 Tax=Henosepilachna vigintioctopunctata TaxID=420089 RepID=A0AAW1V9K4_9CUCU